VLLGQLAEALTMNGDRPDALEASRESVRLLRARKNVTPSGAVSPAYPWWVHYRVLAANGLPAEAFKALEAAHRIIVKRIAGVSDEGIRRSYFSHVPLNRDIVVAWLEESRRRRLPAARRTAHLAAKANLREPFERLVDTGVRLNELRGVSEVHDFVLEETQELSGAERVLLVLERSGGIELAGSIVPRGEDAKLLLATAGPELERARRLRATAISHEPASAPSLEQRSRIVAPLVAQRELLGYIYLDIDGAFGRFGEADRDLIAMFASQAAVALDNARSAEGLERKVAERTAEIERRANELAVINSIQQGMASKLDFQGIVDLVGEKLREVFGQPDIGIRWWDQESNQVLFLYEYEHGKRLRVPPAPARTEKPMFKAMLRGETVVMNNRAEMAKWQLTVIEGTDQSHSCVMVPIVGTGGTVGSIVLENYEREGAYGEADVRLLTTVASSMGVALENARLFDETQRLLKETEQRNAELAIINSVQEGLASKLDIDAIFALVGDKIREIFAADTTYIGYHDASNNSLVFPYYMDRGAVPVIADNSVKRGRPWGKGFTEMIIESGKPLMLGTSEEQRLAGGFVVTSPGAAKDLNQSYLGVPIFLRGKPYGVVSVQSYREHAFVESDQRLLSTLASTMGVALENARLFDETQRLLKETEQRAAELAVINSIQQGIASKLDFQGIVDLVGDKVREVFHGQDLSIRLLDQSAGLVRFPYSYEHGRRIEVAPIPIPRERRTFQALLEGRAVVANSLAEMQAWDMKTIPGTDPSKSVAIVPVFGSGGLIGAIVVSRRTCASP
jgi:GAF domain-containing protein